MITQNFDKAEVISIRADTDKRNTPGFIRRSKEMSIFRGITCDDIVTGDRMVHFLIAAMIAQ